MVRSPGFESQHHIKLDWGVQVGGSEVQGYPRLLGEPGAILGCLRTCWDKSKKQGWSNPSSRSEDGSGRTPGRAGGHPPKLEKPEVGSELRTAEFRRPRLLRPRETETEGAAAQATRVRPTIRIRNRFLFGQKRQVPGVAGLGGDFRPALTSRTSCSRHRLPSAGPAGRSGSPPGPGRRDRTGLRRGACVVRTREEGAAGQGCGCAEAGPAAAPAQWRGGAGRREAVAPAAAAEKEEEGGGSGGRCFCQFRLFVREVDPPLPEQPGGSCGSRGQCRPRPPARPRAPPPPAMARDYDHLFKLLIIGDSGEGRRGRRRRGPCRARPAGASGRVDGRAGGRGGAARAGREARSSAAAGPGGAAGGSGLRLGGSGCPARGMHGPALAPASRVTLVKSRDCWSWRDPGSSPWKTGFFTL